MFFSKNIKHVDKAVVVETLNMRLVDEQSLYLGLPSTIDRIKTVVFAYIKDKIKERIRGWSGRCISGSGKEILIKKVLQVVPTYTMNIFLITSSSVLRN